MIDLTCIVNLHREGRLAHRTLRSVQQAIDHAKRSGLAADLLIVCDNPDSATIEFLQDYWAKEQILTVNWGDLGLARNSGVEKAQGQYIAFVDGDDLISENWLTEAYKVGERDATFIMHPEANVVFDQAHRIFYHPDQPEGPFRDGALGLCNFWSALSCARRSTYLAIPYAPHPADSGFGYEDWLFNCETIAAGYRHRVVPRTAHFIRTKADAGLCQRTTLSGAILRHNALFDAPSFYENVPLHPVANT